MNKEEYVTYETAELLKEKGFDWECNRYYLERVSDNEPLLCPGSTMYGEDYNKRLQQNNLGIHINVSSGKISAPTQQRACHWLYKEKGFYIAVLPCEKGFHTMIYHTGVSRHLDYLSLVQDKEHDNPTPQQAIEAALKYCLTKLI